MIICVTAEGDTLSSQVDQRFGRAQYFLFVDMETGQSDAVVNPNVSGMGGVGIQSAQLVAGKGAQVLLTGKVGPNASRTLQAAGIEVVLDVSGDVSTAVDKYKKRELSSAQGPNVPEKAGFKDNEPK